MGKLQVGRIDGKKGSTKPVNWDDATKQAFEELKRALATGLEVFRLEPDQPFVLRTDASDFAIGAVLEQEREGKWVPVAFHSRKLAKSQLNWTAREKETYAIVAALRKWAGWVGFQPIIVKTDYKSVEDWVTEQVDTPSGQRGIRSRWHETLSQFNLQVEYIQGKDNDIADAMSRYAYPASSAREDVSFHGSAQADAEVKKLIAQELAESRLVGIVRIGGVHIPGIGYPKGQMFIAGQIPSHSVLSREIRVVTRSGQDSGNPPESCLAPCSTPSPQPYNPLPNPESEACHWHAPDYSPSFSSHCYYCQLAFCRKFIRDCLIHR